MSWWKKTSLANITSAFILVSATLYFIFTKYNDGIMFLVGFAAGWLYGRRMQQ
ncbi:MAG: hypothetical protein NDF57_05135 [archaeon GBS-70-058]|nr:hypothetical protein [Candidatus Culexarchaeum nevadense]